MKAGAEILFRDGELDSLLGLLGTLPEGLREVVVGKSGGFTDEERAAIRGLPVMYSQVRLLKRLEPGPRHELRNQIHDQMTTDIVIWFDSADRLTGDLTRAVERLAKKSDTAALVCPYQRLDEEERAVSTVWRERLVWRDLTRWEGPVAETLEWQDATSERWPGLMVTCARDSSHTIGRALDDLGEARKCNDGSLRCGWLLARSAFDAGEMKAAAAYAGLLADSPDDMPDSIRYAALLLEAESLIELDNLHQAQGSIRKAIALIGTLGEAYFLAAEIHEKLGDPNKAGYWLDRGYTKGMPGPDWPAPWNPQNYTDRPQALFLVLAAEKEKV